MPHIVGDQSSHLGSCRDDILGAMLVEPVAIIDATMLLLKTDDFALDSHRKIYAAMLQLVERVMGSISSPSPTI
jgi:replicative DNA helicase